MRTTTAALLLTSTLALATSACLEGDLDSEESDELEEPEAEPAQQTTPTNPNLGKKCCLADDPNGWFTAYCGTVDSKGFCCGYPTPGVKNCADCSSFGCTYPKPAPTGTAPPAPPLVGK